RLWWMLRWLGHDAVAVLDGGMKKWTGEQRPTRSGVETRETTTFTPVPRPGMRVDAAHVAPLSTAGDWRLVDARAPAPFRGEAEPIDKKPGHIPGAVNHFFGQNIEPSSGTFRTPEELRASLAPALTGIPGDHVVCYCGSGVTACHNLLALEHAG